VALTSLEDLLIAHEGVRLKPYDDATGKQLRKGVKIKGKITIGVGRNLSDRGISQDELSYLLATDIEIAKKDAATFDYFEDLNDPRQAVIVSMCFNIGLPRWRRFKRTHAAILKQDFETAAVELLASRWSVQVGDRSLHLAEMLRSGKWLE
jgi:lysozyme|tara:strand:+ start:616 stop:1068 length:453 start_codon:yes stop_codon:yes gene_type:complete